MGLASKLKASQQGAAAALPQQQQGQQQMYGAPPPAGGYAPPPQGAPGYAPPGAPAPGQYAPPPAGAPGGPGQYAPPPAGAPGGPGQYAPPPASAPGGYAPPPASAPGGYAPPPASAPGGYAPPPTGGAFPPGAPPPGPTPQRTSTLPPAQQYGTLPPPAAGGGQQYGTLPASQQSGSYDILSRHLRRIVTTNQITQFYPEATLNALVSRLAAVDFSRLSSAWNIPKEIAYDVSALALYDVVFFCDDSGSMRIEEGGERIEDLKLILQKVAEFAVALDDDGISVRFMNSAVTGDRLRTEAEIAALINRVNFNGLTPLGTQLRARVIDPLVMGPAQSRQLRKPVLVIVITDGEPVGEDRGTIKNVVIDARNRLAALGYPPKTVAFTFAQCGKDMGAQRFLSELDRDAHVGKMIDCVSYYELEAEEYRKRGIDLTPELFLVKLCIGSVDDSYDEQDE